MNVPGAPTTVSGVTIKSSQEINAMRRAGAVVAATVKALLQTVEPGMTTRHLDNVAAREIKRLGAKPAFLGYRGFPATICTSINEEIVHGIPGDRVIREGDLVKMDVGAIVDGLYGDSAVTVAAGRVADDAQGLHRRHQRVPGRGHRPGASRRQVGGHRRRRAAVRRVSWLLGGAGVRRPWHRAQAPRGPPGAQLRHRGARAGPTARHGHSHRSPWSIWAPGGPKLWRTTGP